MPARRNYKKEAVYESSPEQVRNRVLRNKARRHAIAAGLVKKGDGKDIDHSRPLSKGGSGDKSNLRVVSASENRSFKRNSSGGLVSQTSRRERRGRKK